MLRTSKRISHKAKANDSDADDEEHAPTVISTRKTISKTKNKGKGKARANSSNADDKEDTLPDASDLTYLNKDDDDDHDTAAHEISGFVGAERLRVQLESRPNVSPLPPINKPDAKKTNTKRKPDDQLQVQSLPVNETPEPGPSNPVVAPKHRGPGRKSKTEPTTITEADANIILEDSVADVWKHVLGIGQYIV